nr:hypothetical protein [Tanacetum cinerariifolium]
MRPKGIKPRAKSGHRKIIPLLMNKPFSKLKYKLEKAQAEATLLKAQPAFPYVQQLTKLLVTSLKPELSKLLTDHDFSTSIPTELKELPSKVYYIKGAVRDIKKYEEKLEIEVPGCRLAALKNIKLDLPRLLALLDPPKTTPQTKREQIRDKGKKAISHDETTKEESKNDSDAETRPTAEGEQELDLSKPLEEQDPISKLNLLAKKKRKNVVDLHDYFKSTQRLHQGPEINDLARTFNTFLVVEVEKRNLNPNKQMRLIKQLRQ